MLKWQAVSPLFQKACCSLDKKIGKRRVLPFHAVQIFSRTLGHMTPEPLQTSSCFHNFMAPLHSDTLPRVRVVLLEKKREDTATGGDLPEKGESQPSGKGRNEKNYERKCR